MVPLLILLYILLCCVVGALGMQRRLGFTGFFIISLVLTPPVTLLMLLITKPKIKN